MIEMLTEHCGFTDICFNNHKIHILLKMIFELPAGSSFCVQIFVHSMCYYNTERWGNKMDIYSFLNSNCVREYLIKINYQFSISEAFFVIAHSMHKTLKEKQMAYDAIIKEYKEEDIMHKLISEYKELEQELADNFLKSEDAVYCNDEEFYGYEDEPFTWCNLYYDLDLCLKENTGDGDKALITKHYIKKTEDDDDYRSIRAELSKNGDIILVSPSYRLTPEKDKVFCSMQKLEEKLNIPLPFKEGDRVIDRQGNELVFRGILETDGTKLAKVSDDTEKYVTLGYIDFEFKSTENK